MLVTYKNNRLVPAFIITACFLSIFWFIDPSVDNYGFATYKATDEDVGGLEHLTGGNTAGDDSAVNGSTAEPQSSVTDFEDDGIVLILKTGGTTMWKRLLVHLTTTLSNTRISPSNSVIYSDYAERVANFELVDALANMTDAAKQSDDFTVYRQQPEYDAYNYYVEAAGVNGDEWGPVGGWIVDKYKFLPLMKHAGENWPRAKWYVYMEDDAYLFMPNIRSYLAKFDWKGNHYLGSYAAKSDAVFAHGGAGFALSRGAWEATFGQSPMIVEDYFQYTADHCCGDQVLGLALKDHGVQFGENGGDGKFTWGFNPVVHWAFAFERSNWCHPLLSWHKVHNRDVARYYELERSWDFSKPLLYGDFFTHMILPHIQNRAEWWDNMAAKYEVSSANQEWAPTPQEEGGSSFDAKLWKKAWNSVDDCEAACKGWTQCAMWSFVEDLCKMDDKMIMGQGYAPGMSQRKTALMHTSGWMPQRLDEWHC